MVRFMNALNSRVEELKNALEELKSEMSAVKESADVDDWDRIKVALEAADKMGARTKYCLWLAPESVKEKVGGVLENSLTFVDALQKVHDGATAAALLATEPTGRSMQERGVNGMKVVGIAVPRSKRDPRSL